MLHHLQHIVDLVEICRLKGIRHVVVSPGSRNAALIKLFASNNNFKLHSIVDERSAGFYGLGMAIATHEKVALLSTSGTAVINFGPALCEAYYQRIPLIAITADRPEHLIDQQDNQTIRQHNIFQNYIKQSITLLQPLKDTNQQLEQTANIDTILNTAVEGIPGPVHINVPIDEPFYIEMPEKAKSYLTQPSKPVAKAQINKIAEHWKSSNKIMIIAGEMLPNEQLNQIIHKVAESRSVIVFAEPISNLKGTNIIQQIDPLFWKLNHMEDSDFIPDFLISFGGPVVSKHLKIWLQKHPEIIHFRISEAEDHIDTYQNLNKNIIGEVDQILSNLPALEHSESNYKDAWNQLATHCQQMHHQFLQSVEFSDLKVYHQISKQLPKGSVLHIGNSAPIRYLQLFNLNTTNGVYSNRGVSGIDGCVSTASGFATLNKHLNILVVGDLSFLYDSNALWNRAFPKNLKIIVINNNGGAIFSMIPGPDRQEGFEEFMQAHHPVNFEFLAKAYGINYTECHNEQNLDKSINNLFQSTEASLLVIHTSENDSALIYKKYVSAFVNTKES